MPELQEKRRGPKRLKNVEMADTLYLPEKVQLEGDTVILVRNLIFEGKDAVIRGPFNIYFYPIDEAGVLGTSFEIALARARRTTGARFINASWTSNRSLPVLPVIRGGTITIDTSGLRGSDWRENQRAVAKGRAGMIKAGLFQQQGQPVNTSGPSGGDRDWGVEGAQGTTGNTGTTGSNGTCGSTSSVNGGNGGAGITGGIGGTGTPGLGGGNGGDAGEIDASIPDFPVGNYFFIARGGDGALVATAAQGEKVAPVDLAGLAAPERTAPAIRAVRAQAGQVARAELAVRVALAVLAERVETVVMVVILPSITPTIAAPATSLKNPIPGVADWVLPVVWPEYGETADRAALVVLAVEHRSVRIQDGVETMVKRVPTGLRAPLAQRGPTGRPAPSPVP